MQINLPKPLLEEHGKKAVILLHAYSGSPNDVHMLSRFLEKANYTVYAPMFSGHGTMEPQDILDQKVDLWFQNTQAAIERLKEKGYKQLAVLGLSMGGIMAMGALIQKDPAVIGGGCFCSPIFKTHTHVPENFYRYAKKVLSYTNLSEENLKGKLASIAKNSKVQLKEIENFSESVSEKVSTIRIPVFLAQAGQDQMIDASTVFKTMQALEQTKTTLQWYPESDHVVTVGPERKQFEKDVLAYLESLPWNEE
ncbi:alpha/beta hydrolase [Tetragenococcus koreensis]|uniref:Carboxylesterase n=1 Tax=Tetragenococcus koreensis TaxID=290335 RepID=A0AAN4UCD9_9ENTE|nr:alpha/beta fold hydrolase [Tetragenococcus koreensis]AYW45405.1 carboxylesterase [Tetragenococcus koreensis]MCF1618078.1 alpha/beta hydrolase [Tetragenococcus koreensis]MCF1622939.1 alpha/beta hydrolase [Tetragenococcus koreensis]MCF1626533.1 alpha/beta hydrolase [Tetragenococcus koreensis]MCF1631619.1 alpha/beta hydrolase [Tetragenococcus koreensis]